MQEKSKKDVLRSVKGMILRMVKKPNKDQRGALVEALKTFRAKATPKA